MSQAPIFLSDIFPHVLLKEKVNVLKSSDLKKKYPEF